ncbi:Serine/threonine-protein phosphatase 2A activator [Rhynchospora pubera]|uniref:Serine/threonine-protein phosphatase 2A activator n=1 Tax=Rhynchospora pubera TaxID=906938 RepID=A0AAV8FGX7_9POAL|nr:Serine/threonine-protein phosphatase 2A activator [Rhynchospora pubera]KAJ4790212.1 Serine/threonine-protein phosphatase 2A activator [Rhynchospora pubera]
MSDPESSPLPSASASASTPPPPSATCRNCGGPTCRPSPPTPAPWSEVSPPPAYRPNTAAIILSPAINAPTNTAAIILSPVPQPLPVPVAAPPFHFQPPSKRIASLDHLRRFNDSPSARHFLGFVASLSHSVRSRKLSDPLPLHFSPVLTSLVSLLQTLSHWVDQIPPLPHQARYGNPAYRLWHERLSAQLPSLLNPVLSPPGLQAAEVELLPYLLDSFGNATRIDYGTGHETNFAAFLYCLARLDLIKEEDYPALVTRVFVTYLDLMRKLQNTYCLEPAGSHGVWGLDDYHFLPFIFGSAQLIDHKYMKPKSIHNPDILENFSHEYMYLGCVSFVKKAKKGVFAEHSPMLDDISGVAQWSKVNSGLLKMYKAEVLEKVPIMQHFLFGSLIKWE